MPVPTAQHATDEALSQRSMPRSAMATRPASPAATETALGSRRDVSGESPGRDEVFAAPLVCRSRMDQPATGTSVKTEAARPDDTAPKGRGGAWTDEPETSEEGSRRLEAPRR